MKTLCASAAPLLLSSVLAVSAQPAFQNLDFESAVVPILGPGEYKFIYGGAGEPFADAFPGWTGYFGTNPVTQVSHNIATLGAYNISILDSGGSIPNRSLDGNFSILLQAGDFGYGNPLPATIAQSGLVPPGAHSLWMRLDPIRPVDLNGVSVLLGGTRIALQPQGNGYYAGDISAFAGQVEELSISALPLLPYNSNFTFELDDILFSPQVVPEPALLLLSPMLLVCLQISRSRTSALQA